MKNPMDKQVFLSTQPEWAVTLVDDVGRSEHEHAGAFLKMHRLGQTDIDTDDCMFLTTESMIIVAKLLIQASIYLKDQGYEKSI